MNFDKLNHEFLNFPIDYLYHLGIDSSLNLTDLFKEVKFAIFTRAHEDASIIAHVFAKEYYQIKEDSFDFNPIYKTERFHFYKIGTTIIVSAGIGMPSTLICLNEIAKLFVHAKTNNPTFFYIGAAGGLGIPIGSLVINDKALNSKLEAKFTSVECGIEHSHPSHLDSELNNKLFTFGVSNTNYNIVIGSAIGAYDYYDEQARLDGFLPLDYTKEEQLLYLKKAKDVGVQAINMESLAFAGFCNQLEIKSAIISTVVNNRFVGDKVLLNMDEQNIIMEHAASLCSKFIIECEQSND